MPRAEGTRKAGAARKAEAEAPSLSLEDARICLRKLSQLQGFAQRKRCRADLADSELFSMIEQLLDGIKEAKREIWALFPPSTIWPRAR